MTTPNWRKKLKYYRKKSGITQEALAVKLNTRQQTIVNWEKEDGTNPSIDELYQITKFLGISMNDLFEEDEEQLLIAAEPEATYNLKKKAVSESDNITERLNKLEKDVGKIIKHLKI